MMTAQTTPLVPVSWGELLDKITILEIKQRHISRPDAHANVARELQCLSEAARPALSRARGTAGVLARLKAVNQELWDIEDAIREHEAAHDFGSGFVALARAVYMKNDERAALKRQLNEALGSELVEEKSYASINRPVMRAI